MEKGIILFFKFNQGFLDLLPSFFIKFEILFFSSGFNFNLPAHLVISLSPRL